MYRAAIAEPHPGAKGLTLTTPGWGPHKADIQPHWVNLASNLTKLNLQFKDDIGHATMSALEQLSKLKVLVLDGVISSSYPKAHIELSLPELWKLGVGWFTQVRITLNCPRLSFLGLAGMYPLESLQSNHQSIKLLWLSCLGEGSLSLQDVFGTLRLQGLTYLRLSHLLAAHEDPDHRMRLKPSRGNSRMASYKHLIQTSR